MTTEDRTTEEGTLALGGSAVLIASLLGNGLAYAFSVVLARLLGASEFGLYALGFTIFNLLSLMALLGLDTGLIRFISEHLGRGEKAQVRRVIIQAMLIALPCGLVAAVALALAAPSLAKTLYGRPELGPVLSLFAVAVPLASLTGLLVAALQACQTVWYTVVIRYLWEPLGKIALATLFLWAGFGLPGVVLAIGLTLGVSLLIGLAGVRRLTGLHLCDVSRRRTEGLRELAVFCLPLSVAGFVGVVAQRSDILILGYWVTAQEVGVYLAAFQTSAILALVLGAFDTTLAPIVGRTWALHDLAGLERAYQEGTRLVMTCTIPVCLVMIIWGSEILQIFGGEFSGGATCLTILILGQLVNSGTAFSNTVLLMTGHSRLVLMNTIIFAVLLIGMMWILVSLWGTMGAAVAASACLIGVNTVRVMQVWRLLGVHPWAWSLVKPLAAGAGAAVLVWGIMSVADGGSFLFPATFLCLLYSGLLFLFGLEPGDRELFGTLTGKLKLGWGER